MRKKDIKTITERYGNDETIKEIASDMGIEPGEVYKVLRSQKVKLRRGGWRPRTGRKKFRVEVKPSELKKLKAPHGAPTNTKVDESGKSDIEKFYEAVDAAIPDAIGVVKDALKATRLSFGGKVMPDWKSRVKAAEILINKRLPDVRAIEVSGPDGGAIEVDLETKFSELDNSSFSKEFDRLLQSLGKEPGAS